MRASVFLLVLSVVTSASLCPTTSVSSESPRDITRTIHIDGFERSYLLHLPPKTHSITKLPLLIMLHGRGASSQSAANDFGWTEKADKEGFIVAFPQALPFDPGRPSGIRLPDDFTRYWRIPTNDSFWWTNGMAARYAYLANTKYPRVVHPVDTPFLFALLHDVLQRYEADPRRVFVVGFSNGGYMAANFAQAASEKIAGVGIVGWIGPGRPRQLAHPLSVFLSIGTDDGFGQPTQTDWKSMPPIIKKEWYGQETLPTLEEDVTAWARLDQCKSHNTTSTAWGKQIDWTDCLNHTRVRGFSVSHLEHEWPGSKPSRWNRVHHAEQPLNLTDVIWEFLQPVR